VAALLLLLLIPAPDYSRVDFGKTTSSRVKLLRHEHPGVRRRAAMLLAHAPKDEAIAGLLNALGDPNPAVREAAAGAVATLRDERAVPFLARRIRSETSSGALATEIVALARCGKAYVARRIGPYLEHPVRDVRAAAAVALGQVGDAGQRAALWAALRYAPDDPGFVVRAAILESFAELGWTSDVRLAAAELEKEGILRHWRGRVAFVGAAGKAGLVERIAWLAGQLEHDDPRVVAAAAGALARLGRLDAVAAALGHPSPSVRRAALVALQEAGDRRAVERAREMVRRDRDVGVRFEAALVLHHAKQPGADAYLVDALRSREPVIWITALTTLERRHKRSFGRNSKAWTEFLEGG